MVHAVETKKWKLTLEVLRSVVDNRTGHVDVVTFRTEVCFFFRAVLFDSDTKTVPSLSRGCSRRLRRLKIYPDGFLRSLKEI